jgi:hypothetical protein
MQRLFRFTFEYLQQERELSYFDSLSIYVYAIDIVPQDAFLLTNGQMPLTTSTLVDFPCMLFRAVLQIPITMPND